MITGCHFIIYSKNPEKDRDFFKKVLKFPHVDVGDGWLIFGLPPSEVAVHPSEKNNIQELYLMCDDIKKTITQMKKHKVQCGRITDQPWGLLTDLKLPGGGKIKIYQPFHDRPMTIPARKKHRVISST